MEQARQQTGFIDNQPLGSYITSVGLAMARASERPDLPWEFHVMDDASINAFAAPGGFIFVTRGILAVMNSEAELAGVIGHEIGHVTAKHTVNQISKQQLLTGVLIAGAIAKPDLAQGLPGQLAQAGAGLLLLQYGRDDERQSDQLGHRYSLHAGYDVREMPKTFATIERVSQQADAGRLPGFLSTHPDPGDRVAATQSWADTVSSYANLRTDRDDYLNHLDGMVFGQDPRQGYFDDNRFLHPVLRFQFDAPVNWQGANQATRVVMVEPNGQAQIELSAAAEASAAAASQAFASQQGIEVTGSGSATVNGLPARAVAFSATTSQGQALVGEVLFIEHRGGVYRFLGLTLAASAGQWMRSVQASLRSFASTSSNQQFRRVRELDLITLSSGATVDRLAAQSGGAATVEELALINGVQPGEMMAAGRRVKTIRYR
jgi:predicted Zn-dependent protease